MDGAAIRTENWRGSARTARGRLGRGLVAYDAASLARRAKEWDGLASAAEARLAFWQARGDGPETKGAIARAGWLAARAREMADSYRREVGELPLRPAAASLAA